MCALAVTLCALLICTITEKITFKNLSAKTVTPSAVTHETTEETDAPAHQSLQELAASLEIDTEQFTQCMEERRHKDVVQGNIDSGEKAGVKGTPHSFVLIDDAIYEIPGAYEEAGMREFFDDLLAGNEPRATDVSAERDVAPVTDDDWIIGEETARITVIEYSDIDCPYCKKFHKSTANMRADYADDVRWVFRHMPIDGLHPGAREKAEAAECVGEIGGGISFWKYIDTLFE